MSSPQLPGTVQSAEPDLTGFDTDSQITSLSMAQQIQAVGYDFCARYLSLSDGQEPGDLSYEEATYILDAGMALVAVQHVPGGDWAPSSQVGTTYGANAASNAASIGLPTGVNIWCDLESIAAGTPASAVIDYCTSWYNAVFAAEYVPGLYVGANSVLDGNQLYDLPFEHYWRSESTSVPVPDPRGYQMLQYYNDPAVTVAGIAVDVDTTQNDNEGGSVIWLKS